LTLGQAAGTQLPTSLWTLNPSNFQEIMESGRLKGWRHCGKTDYALFEVVHSCDFNPDSLIRGTKPTDPLKKQLDIMFQSLTYNKAFFDNFARLGVVFTTDGNLSDAQFQRIKAHLESNHKGSSKAFKSLIMEGGLKPTEMGANHKDMDFLEQLKFGREEILGTFRTPKALFNITESLNYATFNGQMKAFWQYGLSPILRKIEEALNEHIVKPYAPHLYCKFDLSQVPAFQADLSEIAATAKTFFDMGVPFNRINERLGLGFEPTDTGEIGYLPFNLAPAGETYQAEEESSTGDNVDAEAEDSKAIVAVESKVKGIVGKKEKQKRAEMVWKAYIRGHGAIEGKLQKVVKDHFYEQRNRVLNTIAVKGKAIEIALDWEFEEEQFKKKTKPVISEGVKVGSAWGEYSLGIKLKEEVLRHRLETLVVTRQDSIARSQRTVKELVNNIMRGQAEGESIDDIASRIKKVYTEAGNRAKTIARTETGCAINSGAYQYYKAVEEVENVTVMKEWITAGDENVRDSHVMVDGETVHLDGVFANGLMYPNDPDGDASEVINCRCAYITVTELKG